ncbi:DUF3995 domain-containing protein [Streptomyces sp. NPDC029216]|uniref:DUF3995 domain-containing protein n=1 Tax=Streptomyces sp. NPDC029216 TaxID=3154701 RepID=UPI00340CE8EF
MSVLTTGGTTGAGEPGAGATAPAGPDTATRAAATTAAGALIAAGALHAAWVFTPWPLESRARMAEIVVGVTEDRLPSPELTFGVAGLLAAAGYLVLDGARLVPAVGPAALRRAGLWAVSGVLGARGVAGLAADVLALGDVPPAHRHWDLVLYSPLCLGLAALTGYVAARTRPPLREAPQHTGNSNTE